VNAKSIRAALRKLPLGGLRFYQTIDSTSDMALAWAAAGARDLSLVAADGQTRGRGRGGRPWLTPPGSALAFSLVLRPGPVERDIIPLYSALGALAVAQTLEGIGLAPQIKWPNDVLLDRRKVCGILAESVWLGEKVDSLVLGIGVNVGPESVPPAEMLAFPAACLESAAGRALDRPVLLGGILSALLEWRPRLGTDAFLQAWERRLAFRGETVEVWAQGMPARAGQVLGLERDGGLRLLGEGGQPFAVRFGEVRLRPVI
jgi:BirA family biotin operon repressor/biotin-[acetyl-CoA-carboxylase] ligase